MDRSEIIFNFLLLLTLANAVFMLNKLSSTYYVSDDSQDDSTTSIEGMSKMKHTKQVVRSHRMKKMFIYHPGNWDGAPIVIDEYKLIFFTQGKVSCTVFKQLLRRMMNHVDWRNDSGKLPHNPRHNGLRYLYHYPPDEALKMMTSTNEGWTRAIFVRDPLERLLSAYLDKGKHKHGVYLMKHCKDVHHLDLSFEEFVDIVLSSCKHDPHWMPQSQRIDEPFWQSVNFVGNFGSLQQDARKLLNRLDNVAWEKFGSSGWGPNFNESIFSPATHARHQTGARERFREYYQNRTVKDTAIHFYHNDYVFPYFKFRKQ